MANGTIAFDTLTTSDSVKSGTEKSVDTSYIYNGVTKVWFRLTGVSTASLDDSLNVSSFNDEGTGNYKVTYTNNMNNITYSYSNGVGWDVGGS